MRSARVIVLLAGLAVAGAAAVGAGPPPGGEVERLREENVRLRARVRALEAEAAELRILAGVVPAPGAAAHVNARVETRFDEARGMTSVAGRATRLAVEGGVRGRHWMTLRYEHPGREPAAPVDGVLLELEAASARAAYRDARTVTLVIDGSAVECAIVGYRFTPLTVGSGQRRAGAREVVLVAVPRAILARVADAGEVGGEIGPTRFRLTPEQIVEFRVFERRLGG